MVLSVQQVMVSRFLSSEKESLQIWGGIYLENSSETISGFTNFIDPAWFNWKDGWGRKGLGDVWSYEGNRCLNTSTAFSLVSPLSSTLLLMMIWINWAAALSRLVIVLFVSITITHRLSRTIELASASRPASHFECIAVTRIGTSGSSAFLWPQNVFTW